MCIIIFGRRKYLALERKLDVATRLLEAIRQPPAPTKPKPGKWFTVAQVCEFLQISDRTLARMRQRGEIPCNMVGHKSYYSEDVVRRLLNERLMPEREALVDATPGTTDFRHRYRKTSTEVKPTIE